MVPGVDLLAFRSSIQALPVDDGGDFGDGVLCLGKGVFQKDSLLGAGSVGELCQLAFTWSIPWSGGVPRQRWLVLDIEVTF